MHIHFRPFNARRIGHSMLDGRRIALSNMFDCRLFLLNELRSPGEGYKILKSLLTDNKFLLVSISKILSTAEHNLLLKVATVEDPAKDQDMFGIRSIHRVDNLAYGIVSNFLQYLTTYLRY